MPATLFDIFGVKAVSLIVYRRVFSYLWYFTYGSCLSPNEQGSIGLGLFRGFILLRDKISPLKKGQKEYSARNEMAKNLAPQCAQLPKHTISETFLNPAHQKRKISAFYKR